MLGDATVDATLADLATAPIAEPLRATLGFLRKITREHGTLTGEDVAALLAAGVTRAQVVEAINVAFAFNVLTRLADTFHFEVGPRAVFDAGASWLLTRGYR